MLKSLSQMNILPRLRSFFKKYFFFLRPKVNYLALGDSSVEGIGASHPQKGYVGQLTKMLEKDYRVKAVNLGRGGSTTQDVIADQLPYLVNFKPDIITFSIGPNDIRNLMTIGEFRQNLEIILDELSKIAAKVLINTIPDMSRSPIIPKLVKWIVKIRVNQFNNVITELAARFNVTVCDLYKATSELEYPDDFLSEDKFHPSDLGYAHWAQTFFYSLQPIL